MKQDCLPEIPGENSGNSCQVFIRREVEEEHLEESQQNMSFEEDDPLLR